VTKTVCATVTKLRQTSWATRRRRARRGSDSGEDAGAGDNVVGVRTLHRRASRNLARAHFRKPRLHSFLVPAARHGPRRATLRRSLAGKCCLSSERRSASICSPGLRPDSSSRSRSVPTEISDLPRESRRYRWISCARVILPRLGHRRLRWGRFDGRRSAPTERMPADRYRSFSSPTRLQGAYTVLKNACAGCAF